MARHRPAPVLRLVAALAVVALALGVVPATPVGAAEPVPAQADAAVVFTAVEQTPWVERAGLWRLVLDVEGAPAGATLSPVIHERVTTREAYFASLLGEVGDPLDAVFPEVPLDGVERSPTGSRQVSLAVSLRQDRPAEPLPGWAFLSSGLRPGVYPVDLRVTDADDVEIGRVVVHLTRVPSGDEEGAGERPLRIAPIVHLGEEPAPVAEGIDPDAAAAAAQDDLVELIDGLTTGLDGTDDLPITFVPRPESLEVLSRSDTGRSAIADLRAAALRRQVVDGPYVDIPLGAWVDLGLTDELTRQRDRGHTVLTDQLGRVDSSTWDATTGITPAAVSVLYSVGIRTLILGRDALDPAAGPVDGPVTIEPAPGLTLEAVAPDPHLTDALTRRGDIVLDAAGMAAELAIAAAASDRPTGSVIVPPDGWGRDPDQVTALAAVLLDPLAPVQAVSLTELLDSVPSRGPRPLLPVLGPDLGDHPARLSIARARLSSYASLVGSDDDDVAALDQRLLLSGSAGLDAAQRAAAVDTVVARTDEAFAAVRAPARQTVTLTSSTGEIPLTLLNELDVPVRVVIDLRSEGRVDFRGVPRMTTVLEPGSNRIELPVRARAPGDSTIAIVIRTPDDVVVIDEVRYTVRSSAISGIGVVLSAGAVAFLLIWWARHWLRSHRGGGGDDDGGSDDPGPDTPDGPPGAAADPPAVLVDATT